MCVVDVRASCACGKAMVLQGKVLVSIYRNGGGGLYANPFCPEIEHGKRKTMKG